MTSHRQAPYGEWVEMYRHGLPSKKIAEVVRAPGSTVRYHLKLAVAADPRIREEHKASLRTVGKVTSAGLKNLNAVVALFKSESRLPSSTAPDPRERALSTWLLRRRQNNDEGTLAPEYREGLEAISGWEQRTRESKDETQWELRFSSSVAYYAAGNGWPRQKSPDTEEERLLGVWHQYQRTKLAAGNLAEEKAARLDAAMPGWRLGRTKRRKRSAVSPA